MCEPHPSAPTLPRDVYVRAGVAERETLSPTKGQSWKEPFFLAWRPSAAPSAKLNWARNANRGDYSPKRPLLWKTEPERETRQMSPSEML